VLQLAKAPALRGPWTLNKKEVLPASMQLSGPSINNGSNTHLWAPDVHFINATYYLFYGVFDSSTGNSLGFDIAVATSPTVDDGTWTDHGSVGVPENHRLYASLGATLLVSNSSNDGQDFLAWGS
jgi:arabinan endo-1,5-alpha-L-arabinosidase